MGGCIGTDQLAQPVPGTEVCETLTFITSGALQPATIPCPQGPRQGVQSTGASKVAYEITHDGVGVTGQPPVPLEANLGPLAVGSCAF